MNACKYLFLPVVTLLAPLAATAQWTLNPYEHKVFIENKGQFSKLGEEVLYGVNNLGAQLYFYNKGVIVKCEQPAKGRAEGESESEERERSVELETSVVKMEWLRANPNAKVIAEEMVSNYYNYGNNEDINRSVYFCKAYKKLTYKELYPGIDAVYEFHPKAGYKYTLIVHPGADVSQVQMKYHSARKPYLVLGNIRTVTRFGDIIDHAPVSFYEHSRKPVASSFAVNNDVVSFNIGSYDKTQTLVIDPWVIVPVLASNNKAYEVQKDAAGNVYVYGGNPPYTVNKYNSLGASVWTLALPFGLSDWTGDQLVDPAGFTYATQGNGSSANNICKINNTTGTVTWVSNSTGGEFFRLTHNCDKSKVFTAGGAAVAYMREVNQATGAIIASYFILGNTEIKSITRAPNGNYYYLTNGTFNRLGAASNSNVNLFSISSLHPLPYHVPGYLPGSPGNGGGNYIAATKLFIYTYDGRLLIKRNICNGAFMDSTAVPGGIMIMNGGLMVDSCGYVYAGSQNGIYKYDENLVLQTSVATTGAVYDISLGINPGEVLASGDAFVASISTLSICQPVPFPATCPPTLTVAISSSAPTCGSSCVGTATANITSGTPPYTYTWSPGGQTTASISALCAGTYSVNVIDRYMRTCTPTTVTINTNPIPTATVSTQGNVACNGGSTGTATLTASGATSPYTFSWNNGQTSGSGTGLNAGTYTVTVTSANGCSTTQTVSISQPSAVAATVSSSNANCGASNGTASVTASGGTGSFTYSWNPTGQATATATGLSAGTYTVTVTDNNGCTRTATATVASNSGGTASIQSSTNVLCNGGANGAATATITGGTSPYTYSWNNGQATATATGLSAGTYTISITDSNGCVATQAVSISQPSTINTSTSSIAASCGASNGTASVTASGGTGAFTYSWNPTAQATATATGLSAGNYTVTVTDGNGCTRTATATVTSNGGGTAGIQSSTNVLCNGGANGAATATITGGTSPYTYSWNNGQATATATGLSAGTYTISITDVNGCVATKTVSISQPSAVAATAGSSNANCGASNGTASVTASGGTGSFTYSWNPTGQATATATGLSAGTYTVTVTDNNGCTRTATATVASNSGGTASIQSSTNVLCNGSANGAATATITGGTSPYTYSWSNGQATATATGLSAGTYTISITDINGCVATQTVSISQPSAINTPTSTIAASCGASNGTASVTASGGTGAFTYSWNPTGQATATATGLSAGTYTVTVTDNNGCSRTATATVASNSGGTAGIQSSTNVLCNGGSNGAATATISGGTSPYTYSWSNGQATATATGLSAGTYTISITDSNGCVATQTVSISQPSAINPQTSTIAASCGASNGTASVTASGGTGAFTYSWNPTGQATATATGLSAGNYVVTVTDGNGCTRTATATVTSNGGGTASIQSSTNVLCNGGSNGAATATISGGTSPYTYSWSNGQATAAATGLSAGTYTISITDSNGCVATQTVSITQPSSINPQTSSIAANCGASNGTASVTASGGTGSFTYSWNPTGQATATATGLSAGNYVVTVTDGNGCTSTATATVTSNGGGTASIQSSTNVLCNGGANGAATATITGGTSPYTYSWNNGQTTATATGLSAGTYTISITDSNGCLATQTISITQPSSFTSQASSIAASCGQNNGAASLTVSGGTGAYTYSWNNGGTQSAISNLPSGIYTVTITDANGCTQTAATTVGNNSGPTATATAAANIIQSGSSTTLTGTGGGTYTWSPTAGLSCTNCANPTASPTITTIYCVTVTDTSGCTDQACVTVNVETPCPSNTDMIVPNAFSPNGDGHNDELVLHGWKTCVAKFQFTIYDRWGERVFESEDPDQSWDGTYRGKKLDPAVFAYYISATNTNGEAFIRKGNITLVR